MPSCHAFLDAEEQNMRARPELAGCSGVDARQRCIYESYQASALSLASRRTCETLVDALLTRRLTSARLESQRTRSLRVADSNCVRYIRTRAFGLRTH
jgi:hypothetical protein